MLKRLRLKFILVNMTIVTLMLCIIFGVVFYTTHRNLEAESVRMMQMVASKPVPARPGPPGGMRDEIQLPFFVLDIRKDGEIITANGNYYDLSDQELLAHLADIVFSSGEKMGTIPEYSLRFYRVETPRGERLIFSDISSELNTVKNLIRNSLLIGGSSFFAFLLISIFLARWAVKPVEKAWKQQRQFVADASHELKTPLTVIMTCAELLRSPDCADEVRQQYSDSILTMSGQMRTLTESLLELARVDNGTIQTSFAQMDFSRTVADAVLPFEPVCFEKGLCLVSRIEEDIILKGSAMHLRQVLEILLDNAQKYSASDGEIVVTLKRQGRYAMLSVENPGVPIPQNDLQHIFERFYRVDQARTRDGGYGLGLSIAQGIVREHRGRVWAESTEKGNVFFVQIPVN